MSLFTFQHNVRLIENVYLHSYPREKSQGVAFEKSIAPVDLIISLECKPVISNRFIKIKSTKQTYQTHRFV